MRYLIIALVLFNIEKTNAQNLLGKTEKEITSVIKMNDGFLPLKQYTSTGDEYLLFSYDIRNRPIEGIQSGYYYFNSNDICYKCDLIFADLKYLDDRISEIKKDKHNIKIRDKFSYINTFRHYSIDVLIFTDQKGFELVYTKH